MPSSRVGTRATAPATLRPAASDDAPFLRELHDTTREQEVAAWGWPEVQWEAFLRRQFEARNARYARQYPEAQTQIVIVHGASAGALTLHRSGRKLFIVDIAMLPLHRNQGLGSQLLQDILDEAAGDDRAVELRVLCGSKAVRLFERLGFVVAGGDGVYQTMRRDALAAEQYA